MEKIISSGYGHGEKLMGYTIQYKYAKGSDK